MEKEEPTEDKTEAIPNQVASSNEENLDMLIANICVECYSEGATVTKLARSVYAFLMTAAERGLPRFVPPLASREGALASWLLAVCCMVLTCCAH